MTLDGSGSPRGDGASTGHDAARQIQLQQATLNDDGTLTETYVEQGVTRDVTGEWGHDDAIDIVQCRIGTSFGSTSQQDALESNSCPRTTG